MNILSLLRVLFVSLFLTFTVVSCGGGDTNSAGSDTPNLSSDTGEKTLEQKKSPPSNLQYIKTASIVVNELFIRDVDGTETELLKGTPKSVKLVPTGNDFADMYLELTDIPPGEYEQVRLVLQSGEVLLTHDVYVEERVIPINPLDKLKDNNVGGLFGNRPDTLIGRPPVLANPRLFTTQRGNLKFPSGFQSGIKVNIEPPIKVVTNLATELLVLTFDLNKSFVFNGSVTKMPGVKSVLFKPVIKVSNDSTHGIVSLKGLTGSNTSGVKCTSTVATLPGATVSAIDTSQINPTVSTITDANGDAELILLPGNYNIQISKDGYDTVIENRDIYAANKADDLINYSLNKNRDIANTEFDKEVAILMSMMSSLAYKGNDLQIKQDAVSKDVKDAISNKTLQPLYPDLPFDMVKGYEYSRPSKNLFGEYLQNEPDADGNTNSCWKFFRYINKVKPAGATPWSSTQLFVAYNKTGDIVISFEGSNADTDLLEDFFSTDINVIKTDWTLRNIASSTNSQGTASLLWSSRDGTTFDSAVHLGVKQAYETIAGDLQQAIDHAINGIKDEFDNVIVEPVVKNPKKSRIYFTGHSLGGGLANLAAFDFTNYLQRAYGYNKDNIFMYSFAANRTITEQLKLQYAETIPNGYEIVAKDDIAFYLLSQDISLDKYSYTNINNLVLLTSNIKDTQQDGGKLRYKPGNLGKTRLEFRGVDFNSTRLSAACSLDTLTFLGRYGALGHNVKQYIRRLATSVPAGQGIPGVGIATVDHGGVRGKQFRINWTGGIQGPCDFIALYQAPKGGHPSNSNFYEQIRLNMNKKLAVLGNNFGTIRDSEGYIANGTSYHETIKNPYHWVWQKCTGSLGISYPCLVEEVENNDFWVGYSDGFDKIIRERCWNCN